MGLGLRFPFCFFFLPLSSSVLRALSCPQRLRCSHLKPVQDFADEMSNWTRSNVSREQLLRLTEAGQLPPLTEAIEWIVPAGESVPCPPNGYVVSFVASTSVASPSPPAGSSKECCSHTGCNSSTSTRTASNRWLPLRQCARGSSASVRTDIYSCTSSGSPA
jgi:hypothetical protein